MSSQAIKTLGIFKKLTELDKGLGARLPEAYKKFYKEWKFTEPAPIHYTPQEGRWKRDEITGEVHPIQNVPIQLKFPSEHDEQIWGGEGVVQGFQKRSKFKRRVPHFWVPILQRSVVYSEILDKHISVVVTDRTLKLIHANYGFDHYLLKIKNIPSSLSANNGYTQFFDLGNLRNKKCALDQLPPEKHKTSFEAKMVHSSSKSCDLKSLLPLGLKRKILQELVNGCPTYADRPDKQQEIYDCYKQYLTAYTPEEIEWYGYSFDEACNKLKESIEAQSTPVPLKHIYRAQLLDKLKNSDEKLETNEITGAASWIRKINPFGKKHET